MPRKSNSDNKHYLQKHNKKKAVKNLKIKGKPVEKSSGSTSSDSEDENKAIAIKTVAQIHADNKSTLVSAQKLIKLRPRGFLSNSDILNVLELSQPTSETAENHTKVISAECSSLSKLPFSTTASEKVDYVDAAHITPMIRINTFRDGDDLSDPEIIEISQSLLLTTNYAELDEVVTQLPVSPSIITQEAIIRTSHDPEKNIAIEQINTNISLVVEEHSKTEVLPVSLSTVAHEVVIRTSHDPEKNMNLEDIEISDNHLDTSTPLASLSISTIIQNIESDNLSSFNINTPNSSVCANSTHDDTYVPSSGDDTLDTSEKSNRTETPAKKKRKVKKKRDMGKIRKTNKFEWIDTKRKQSKNQGLQYVSRNGKNRSEKRLLPACKDECRLKCRSKINTDIRKEMFDKYWSLGDRARQWDLLNRWCERTCKRRITTEGPSKRTFSVKYYLPASLGSVNERVTVCKSMFLNTFAIGEGVVRTALKKIADGDGLITGRDERGYHSNHPKIINDEMVKSVCEHVNSLNPVESHYTRKDSTKLYLDGDLTKNKMFKLYNEWVPESHSNKAKTLRQYNDIVNENFNIEFHRPKKDQCDECIAYKNLPLPVPQELYDKYKAHLQNKDRARSLKNEDKLSAINSPDTTATAAFDFQKVHSCPHAETSILYYKRKLSVFNFTIFEMGTKTGRCYMWHEGTAKRGANEVASCVYDFIKEQSVKGINTINLYSDNCTGQNRNRIVFMMYLIAAKEFKVNIIHRFLEKGHTQNENDSIHALIERRAKNKEIYTPDQWFALVRWSKETGEPYIVKEIATEHILDFKNTLLGNNWTKNEKNQKIMWSKVREICILSTEPYVLHYKLNFDETYQRVFVRRTQNRRRQNQPDDVLIQAYSGPLTIPDAKLADLKYLCEHNVIPRQYHGFYNSLVSGNVFVPSSNEED